jgi:hypothetical protein
MPYTLRRVPAERVALRPSKGYPHLFSKQADAFNAYNREFGAAKMARARLDEALAAYGRLRDFLAVAEVAFADDPAALALRAWRDQGSGVRG